MWYPYRVFLLKYGGVHLYIRYTYIRGENYYYQRKIPSDLLSYYKGSTHIKLNLRTKDLNQVTKRVAVINKEYESIWASLRSNQGKKNILEIKPEVIDLFNYSKGKRGLYSNQLSTLIHACKDKDDDVRWLIALQLGLGCKLAEVVGLTLSDLRLNVGLPYISFKSNPWRVFKSVSRNRNLPLAGISLWAAYRIVESAKRKQVYAFPRYTNENQCKVNSASATINKWMRSIGINKTTHDLQHTMRVKLESIGVPRSIQDFVSGYERMDKAGNSRRVYGVEQLKFWFDKAAI